ncbi:hypothetical protein CIK05_07780 [Bdellovibrio sp. qaytius]|nr:hypothetical protein CIK05_07780 [Bdellovibrio sp. qaytius]
MGRKQSKNLNFFSLVLFVFIFVNTMSSFAGPNRTTYQAKIIKPNGQPLESSSVNFKFTVLNSDADCILYSETYSAVNMSSTGGLISFSLGSGIKSYPTSATTFENVFSNISGALACQSGPLTFTPGSSDTRKVVMQFHDGNGWQTLPPMTINAVPYAMYANDSEKLGGVSATAYVRYSTIPTCTASEAIQYTGSAFTCIPVGGSGSASVTSGSVITALGYTPADGASVTALTSNVTSVSSTVYSVSSTVSSLSASTTALLSSVSSLTTSMTTLSGSLTSLSNSVAASFAAITGVTSSSIATALGYTPANSATVTTLSSNISTVSSTVNSVSGSLTSLSNSVAASFAAITGVTSSSIATALGYTPANSATVTTLSSNISTVSSTVNSVSSTVTTLSGSLTSLTNSVAASFAAITGVTSSSIATALGYTPANSATVTSLSNSVAASFAAITGVTSSTIATALGYTPANSATVTTLNSNISTVSSTVNSVSSTVASLSNAVASLTATVSGLPVSQWTTSGSTVNYSGNVGIGTTNPNYKLTVSGNANVNGAVVLGNTPPVAGTFDFGPLVGANATYKAAVLLQDTITDFSNDYTAGQISSVKLNAPTNTSSLAVGSIRYTQNVASSPANYGAGIYGSYEILENNGSGTVGALTGVSPLVMQNSPGVVTTAYGINSRVYNYQGTINSSFGGVFASGNLGGTIANNYGIMIDTVGGNVGTNYGLFITDQSAMTASQTYNMYSAGFNSKNIFMGTIGLGVSQPTAKLQMAAGSASIAPMKFTSGTLLTSPQSGSIEYDGNNLYYTDGTNTRRTVANTTTSAVTSSSIATALGYTPANSATVAAITSSQWSTSSTTINYLAGNIGIGTTNPSYLLEVSGSAKVNKLYASDGAFNSPSITFANSPTTGFYNAGGYIGFSIGGALKGTWSSSSLAFNAGGAGPQIYFTGGDAANPSYAFNSDPDTGMFNPNSSGGSNELGFSTSGVERMRIASTGAVGIGTSSPAGVLDIAWGGASGLTGGADISASTRTNNTNKWFRYAQVAYANSVAPFLAIMTGATSTENGVYIGGGSALQPNATAIRMYTGTSQSTNGAALERMTILPSGNVGVGTITPTAKFQVTGQSSSTAALKITSGTLLTSPQPGSIENDGSNLYFTDNNSARYMLAGTAVPGYYDSINTIANASGNIALYPSLGAGTVTVSSTLASSSPSTGALVVKGGMGVAGDIYTSGAAQFQSGVASAANVTNYNLRLSSNNTGSAAYYGVGTGMTFDSFTNNNGSKPIGQMASYLISGGSGGAATDESGGLKFLTKRASSATLQTAMVIDDLGNVGIGTTVPIAALEVSGAITANAGAVAGALNLKAGTFQDHTYMQFFARSAASSTRSGYFGYPAPATLQMNIMNELPGGLALGASGSVRAFIHPNGNVGIGTISPLAILHAEAAAAIVAVRTTTDANSAIAMKNNVTNNGWNLYNLGSTDPTPNGFLIEQNTSGTSARRFTINQSGSVGIGTSAPTSTLSVLSTNNINTGSNLANGIGALRIQDGTSIGLLFDSNQIEQMEPANSLYLNYNSSASTIVNYGGGNVGIGLLTPSTRLDISASGSTMITTGGGAVFRISNPSSANSDYFQIGWLSEDNWGIMSADSATHKNLVVVPFGGNFGVGVTSPTYKLDVAGDIRITGTPYRASGDIAWTVPSDARLKDVISKYNRGLREIANIDTIVYKYKKDNPKQADSTKEYTGVLAQQVQTQIPEAVNVDKDGYLSLNTTPIFWAMINAIKEVYTEVLGVKAENTQLKAQAEVQSRKIQSLEEENAAVKARLERIEKALENQNK